MQVGGLHAANWKEPQLHEFTTSMPFSPHKPSRPNKLQHWNSRVAEIEFTCSLTRNTYYLRVENREVESVSCVAQ